MNSGSSNRCCTLPAGPKQPRQDSCLTQGSLGPPVSLRGCSASTIVFSRRDCSHRGRGRNKRPLPSAPLMASSASITASASGTRESPAQTTEVLPSLDALSAVDGTSVLSWNVLLPNSQDGWWVYKYYSPRTAQADRTWPARKKIFKSMLEQAQADVVCIQEASGESFESDFDFMKGLGYSHVLHRKFRFRSATFWKSDSLELVEAHHKDRTLITSLRGLPGNPRHPSEPMYIVNCHLSGGSDPRRRFGQVEQALDQVDSVWMLFPEVRKCANKRGKSQGTQSSADLSDVPVIVCGDFNSEAREPGSSETAWRALLTCGEIDDTFRETLYPEVAVTSKRKTQPFGPFWDAYHVAYSELAGVAVPATYIAAALDQKFLVNGFEERRAGGPLTLTDELLSSLEAMYARFSGADKGSPIADAKLDRQGIDAWLTAINGEVGRGSEYRSATDLMENNSDHLTFGDFKEIYARELREGKYWGVQHDLNACGVDFSSAADQAKPFEAAFDGIHVNIGAWAVAAVVEPLPRDRKDEVYSLRAYPPNAWHPSDHLPVAAVLRRVPP